MVEVLVIPKKIMQTWKTTELPDKWKPSQASIFKFMPDYEYTLMTDEMNRAFVEKHFPDLLETYDNFPYPIQRADAIRYCWLYIYGGIYIDCDFELLGSLEEMFRVKNMSLEATIFFVPSSNVPSVVTNSMMGSIANHPFWLEMIEEMKKPPTFSQIEKHLLVMNTTGPMSLNRVLKRTQTPHTKLDPGKVNPYSVCETEFNKPNTLVRPLEGSSWVGGATAVYHWCLCKSNYLFTVGVVIGILLIVLYLYYFLLRD